uniref:Glycosyl transferase family 28 C-terminal domain-containing protein n=1 Tax=Zooxanthella nutricula TaxID=1333877 RepID=A0A7S2VNA8_9DINO
MAEALKASLGPAEVAGELAGEPAGGRRLLRGTNSLVTVELGRDPDADASRPYFVGPAYLAELMDVASAAITKPGGGTTAELAYRGLPSVLDASKGAMHWEEFTIQRFETAGRAVALRSSSTGAIEAALRQALQLGRDCMLAQDSRGQLVDSRERLRQRLQASA